MSHARAHPWHTLLAVVLLFAGLIRPLSANPILDSVTIDSTTYRDVRFGPANNGKVLVRHSHGVALVPVEKIPAQYGSLIFGYDKAMEAFQQAHAGIATNKPPVPPEPPTVRSVIQSPSSPLQSDLAPATPFGQQPSPPSLLPEPDTPSPTGPGQPRPTILTGFLIMTNAVVTQNGLFYHGAIIDLARKRSDAPVKSTMIGLRPGLWKATGEVVLLIDYVTTSEPGMLVQVVGSETEPVGGHRAFVLGKQATPPRPRASSEPAPDAVVRNAASPAQMPPIEPGPDTSNPIPSTVPDQSKPQGNEAGSAEPGTQPATSVLVPRGLQPPAGYVWVFTTARGFPATNVTLFIQQEPSGQAAAYKTDAEGKLSFHAEPTASYRLLMLADGYAKQVITGVKPGNTYWLKLSLATPGTGTSLADGAGFALPEIGPIRFGGTWRSGTGETGPVLRSPNGRVQFGDATTGGNFLHAWPDRPYFVRLGTVQYQITLRKLDADRLYVEYKKL